jgi:glycosyltransferase involved in cell wall biosynthesis
MHIAHVNYHFDADLRTPEELLERYHSTVEWCKALKRAGANRVSIVQRFRQAFTSSSDGVDYHFFGDDLPPVLRPWNAPRLADDYVASLRPDIVHLNGSMLFFRTVRKVLDPSTAIVWQHHGGIPPRPPQRLIHALLFRSVDAFFFTTIAQATDWKQSGLLRPHQKVYEIVEASSTFKPINKRIARRTLGLHAKEVFLWVGRLHENKDPITALHGFARIVPLCTNPLLLMVYQDGKLLSEVRRTVATLGLGSHVNLVGVVPHDRLRFFYSAADYFMLGSHQEGSGYALLEALACGVAPLVTDIPPFRKITHDGRVGALWKVGDPESLAQAFSTLCKRVIARKRIREYFRRFLSYDTLGRKALLAYREILESRRAIL